MTSEYFGFFAKNGKTITILWIIKKVIDRVGFNEKVVLLVCLMWIWR
jgi:hypothetical protein